MCKRLKSDASPFHGLLFSASDHGILDAMGGQAVAGVAEKTLGEPAPPCALGIASTWRASP